MDPNGNPDEVSQRAFISITVRGRAHLNVIAPSSHVNRRATNKTTLSVPDATATATAVARPFLQRTSVIWSAVGALAAVAAVLVAWAAAR
ncbi:hypothetical protein ABT131_29890 [Streptomyces sp900105245]|uniref:hypothetical protein n=1 Tax=Streptomyces sp. 900105245 TaxID=3154379 RepID=UPI00332350D1